MATASDTTSERSPFKAVPLAPLPDRPLVSVLLSSYNYARYLPDAIDSVRHQTYQNWELIICDDGSTDASPEMLERYRLLDPRIRVILQPRSGQALALTRAFGKSVGQILCFLDSDDAFMPDKIRCVVEAMSGAPEAGLAVNAMRVVDAAGERIGEIPFFHDLPSGWQGSSLSLTAPQFLPAIPPCSGLSLHRSVAEAIFPLPPELIASADSVIEVLAPMLTPIVALPAALSLYRFHGANVGSVRTITEGQLCKLAAWHREIWRVWRRHVVRSVQQAAVEFPLPSEDAATPMSYAYARFRSDPCSRTIYRTIPAGYFETLPRWYRWFWRVSPWLPNWAFQRTFAFAYGQAPMRMVLGRLLKVCRNTLLGWAARAEMASSGKSALRQGK
jgi:hypothetical protein